MNPPAAPGDPSFKRVLEYAPDLYLLLTPDFRIVEASTAYLNATMTRREAILGKGLFEVFTDNPNDPTADGVRNLRASLERALASKQPLSRFRPKCWWRPCSAAKGARSTTL